MTGVFYVTQTGHYSANAQSTIANGVYMARGFFVPSVTNPSIPLSDVMAFIQNGNNTTLPDIELQAGTRYSYIVVFNASQTASFAYTLTGPGEIYALGSSEAKFFPHLPSATRDVLISSKHLIGQRQALRRDPASGDDFMGNSTLWMKPFGSWASQGNRDGLMGYGANTQGLAVGMERDLTSSLNVGGAFVYAKSDIDSDDALLRQSAAVNLYQAMVYGTHTFPDKSFIDFHVGIAKHTNKVNRNLAFSPAVASSNFDGSSYQFGVALGRNLPLSSKTRFVPSVRADYVKIKSDGFSETGAGDENLIVKSTKAEALILGLEGKLVHQLTDRMSLVSSLGVGYDIVNNRNSVSAAFVGNPDVTFVTYGVSPTSWQSRAGVGVTYKIKQSLDVNARYDVDYREGFLNQMASLNLRCKF